MLDSRIQAKNNTEYHGLERHAWQYHVTTQYEQSYHHWLMAAAWRHEDLQHLGASSGGHDDAIRFCIRQALFNQALAARKFPEPWPSPANYGIDPIAHRKREAMAQAELDRWALPDG